MGSGLPQISLPSFPVNHHDMPVLSIYLKEHRENWIYAFAKENECEVNITSLCWDSNSVLNEHDWNAAQKLQHLYSGSRQGWQWMLRHFTFTPSRQWCWWGGGNRILTRLESPERGSSKFCRVLFEERNSAVWDEQILRFNVHPAKVGHLCQRGSLCVCLYAYVSMRVCCYIHIDTCM